MVPKRSSPFSARARASFTVSRSQRELGAGEVRVEHQAGLLAHAGLLARGLELGAEVRRCGGPARRWPCAAACRRGVHRPRGLALVGDADGGDVRAVDARGRAAPSAMHHSVVAQISSRSCSTQPGLGKYWVNSFWPTPTTLSFASRTHGAGAGGALVDREDVALFHGRADYTVERRGPWWALGFGLWALARRQPRPSSASSIRRHSASACSMRRRRSGSCCSAARRSWRWQVALSRLAAASVIST